MDPTDGDYTVPGAELSTNPLLDRSEGELESSIMESFLGDTRQETESETSSRLTPHYSSPLPTHKWVCVTDLTDGSHIPFLYYPCSPCGCGSPQRPIKVPVMKGQVKEYLNCATLLCQVNQKAVKRGFEFTLMVVGESGLGKSTLINSLFLKDLYRNRDVQDMINKTVEITKKSVEVVEKGVKLRLNIVDTPGFGDALDNTNSWKAVVDYIDQQFEQYRMAEMSVNRTNIQDGRVHCCLYFISPTGHGLRQIDVEFMKALHNKVNIVPVLAKADTLTRSEVHHMKTRIMNELDRLRIKICDFQESDSDDNELLQKRNFDLKRIIPFAVIGSNTIMERNGKRVRARVYPWGVAEVENPAHSDFVHLRNMLIHTHMQELKDMTEEILYENYRTQIMCQNQEPANQDDAEEEGGTAATATATTD